MFKILKQIHNASKVETDEANPESDSLLNENTELIEIEK